MGTSEFAIPSFFKVIESDMFDVVGVITQPDKKFGRKHIINHSPVKKIAIKNNIRIFQPSSLSDQKIHKVIDELNLDVILVAAYGKIIPGSILNMPKYGSINIHPSLLPKYRGPSPLQSAILNGDKYTGTTIMLMNNKMDEGDILFQKKILVKKEYNIESLHNRLADLSADLIENVLSEFINGDIKPIKQEKNKATYTKIIKKEDGRLDWKNTQDQIYRKFKAYHPWPGIFTYILIKNKKVLLKIIEIKLSNSINKHKYGTIYKSGVNLQVATNDNKSIILKRVQLEGRGIISGQEFIQGYNIILKSRLI